MTCKQPTSISCYLGLTAQETTINGGPLLVLRRLLRMQGTPLLRRRHLHAQVGRLRRRHVSAPLHRTLQAQQPGREQ
jgi:hypothetical protein